MEKDQVQAGPIIYGTMSKEFFLNMLEVLYPGHYSFDVQCNQVQYYYFWRQFNNDRDTFKTKFGFIQGMWRIEISSHDQTHVVICPKPNDKNTHYLLR